MNLKERYEQAVDGLFAKIRETQTDNMIKAGEVVADTVQQGKKIWLDEVFGGSQDDLIFRGGGPMFCRGLYGNTYAEKLEKVSPGDLVLIGTSAGRDEDVVNFAWSVIEKGAKVLGFVNMEAAVKAEPIHPSGKKFHEFVTFAVDAMGGEADALLEVDGLDTMFAPISGTATIYIMWNIMSAAIEILMGRGITPGVLKSGNFPGGEDYNNGIIIPHYEKYGW